MKKIILFLLMFLCINNVYAYTYYTDYKEVESLKKLEENDLVKLKQTLNMYYHENIIEGPYLSNTNEQYNYLDKSDYIIYKSNLLVNNPESKPNRQIFEVTDNYCNQKVRYIGIGQINTHDGKLNINNFKATYNKKNINYVVSCNFCNTNKNNFQLSDNSFMFIDLKDYYDIDELNITFDIKNDINKSEIFYMYYESSNDTFRKYYVNLEFDFKDTLEYSYNLNESGLNYTIGDYPLKTLYYYIDKYYKSYNVEKEYSIDYLKEKDEYYNKIDEKKAKYIYLVRDKLELEDKLLINSTNYNLKDFIKHNTKEVVIKDSINIKEDGLYEVIYKMNDNEFKTYFTVDINKKSYNQLIDIINDYSKISKNKTSVISNLDKETNLLNKKLDEVTKNYENKMFNLKTQYNNSKKEINNSVKKESILKINNSKYGLIVLLFLGIIITIYIIIKRKKYN